jgi:hypothetical protein
VTGARKLSGSPQAFACGQGSGRKGEQSTNQSIMLHLRLQNVPACACLSCPRAR